MTKSRIKTQLTGWSDSPPPQAARLRYRVWRCSARKKHAVIVLSDAPTGRWIHYAGRSQPCTDTPDCPYCETGLARRWSAYLMTQTLDRTETGILEITAAACAQIKEWRDAHGSLRGTELRLWRTNQKANGPVHIEVHLTTIDKKTLRQPPDLVALLEHMWSGATSPLPPIGRKNGMELERNGRDLGPQRAG